MKTHSREILRSVLFIIVFWTVTALLFIGLYQITKAVDITGFAIQMLMEYTGLRKG